MHALRSLLHLRALAGDATPASQARARVELAEALRQDPHNVLAHAVRAFALDEEVDLPTARALTTRSPDDWLAWLVLNRAAGGTLDNVEGRRAAFAAVRLAAVNPSLKLPFGPQRPLFVGPDPVLRALPGRPPPPARAAARLARTGGLPLGPAAVGGGRAGRAARHRDIRRLVVLLRARLLAAA